MNHSGTLALIRWKGQEYSIKWSVENDCASVVVTPENCELVNAAKCSIEGNGLKLLEIKKGFDFDYLACDPNQGR